MCAAECVCTSYENQNHGTNLAVEYVIFILLPLCVCRTKWNRANDEPTKDVFCRCWRSGINYSRNSRLEGVGPALETRFE
jgi:hypothetical protein